MHRKPGLSVWRRMHIAATETLPRGSDAAFRIYRCDECQHEMRLTVRAAPPLQANRPRFLKIIKSPPAS